MTSGEYHSSLVIFSTAGASVSLVSCCSLIHCLKIAPSQLVIELQALSFVGTSYKKRASEGKEAWKTNAIALFGE